MLEIPYKKCNNFGDDWHPGMGVYIYIHTYRSNVNIKTLWKSYLFSWKLDQISMLSMNRQRQRPSSFVERVRTEGVPSFFGWGSTTFFLIFTVFVFCILYFCLWTNVENIWKYMHQLLGIYICEKTIIMIIILLLLIPQTTSCPPVMPISAFPLRFLANIL